MDNYETASAVWSRLAGLRQPLITRVERYAALTIPKVCLPDGFNVESMDQTHDYQSLGAQAVNHVVNKLMVAMFAPSRPFFRATIADTKAAMEKLKDIDENQLNEILAAMERKASLQLDKKGQRPKLFQVLRHLVITGNGLMIQDPGKLRIMGIKNYCVKRTYDGCIHTLVIKEEIRFNELDWNIQQQWKDRRKDQNDKVCYYKLIRRTPQGGYVMDQYVDDMKLDPTKFSARWSTEDKCPYKALTWDLADESDYGTGLVEQYAGDFEALSAMAEAIVTGAVVGTEFRWAVAPNGMTSIEDFRTSQNGDAFAGSVKDLGAIAPDISNAVKIAQVVSQEYTQRISRGFLLTSAVTRQAERVTAEEVRMTAMELEGSFGGTYSALAPQLQQPIAVWLCAEADMKVNGTDVEIIIVTGLDALSRNGDLDNLKVAMGTMSQFAQAPDPLIQRIKWQELADFIGQGCGIDLKRFIMSDEEFGQVQSQIRAQQAAQEINTAGGVANAEAAAQPQQP